MIEITYHKEGDYFIPDCKIQYRFDEKIQS